MDRELMQEQVKRWMALIDREDDGTIAGYDWEEVCETNDYDVIDLTADPNEEDSLQAIDVDIDQAA